MNDTDIQWLKASLERIERKIDNLGNKIEEHERRISRLEGTNKFWIPVVTSIVGLLIGFVLGGLP